MTGPKPAMRHPGVAQVAVIGPPDELHGEEVCAVAVPVTGTAADGDGVITWSREHLGRHTHPRRVEFTDALPLGPGMKAIERELRARYTG
ncbi:hypothetical protein GCM10023335_68480 [Streptomyces siamensis]|uniref:AMP-binding enzyme C-terminal domain-containing protein n=1 Tax=Streptomyces siamensis TaxID=1274986 RepID=A0ABP9JED4_9ACTN